MGKKGNASYMWSQEFIVSIIKQLLFVQLQWY